mmetsp:Transcript_24870/g.41759  ORF Transcript_24870/g.41759 Transcript_24870/m.41759 type:complete len:349 (-) Transcript_24870:34-1080(-)
MSASIRFVLLFFLCTQATLSIALSGEELLALTNSTDRYKLTLQPKFHHCIHNSAIENVTKIRARQKYVRHPFERRKTARELQAAATDFKSIRIFADYRFLSASLPYAKANFLKVELVPNAIDIINKALHVVPISGNLVLSRDCERVYSGGQCASFKPVTQCGNLVTIPEEHLTGGILSTDLILYVTSELVDSNVLAYAYWCQSDQHDRPIAGVINFNPIYIDPSKLASSRQLATAIHEMTHTLGFSPASFSLFRDSNGNAWPQVVAGFTERSHAVTKIITPTVLAKVREHFACPSLNGAELEDQGGTGTAGSHWETRIYFNEYMTGQLQFNPVMLSVITLALLEDSGW